MEANPEKVLKLLKSVESQTRKANRGIVELGWRILTFRKLYELKLVPSMSISQNEELSQFLVTLRSIQALIRLIVLGVDDLEAQTLGLVLNAEKD